VSAGIGADAASHLFVGIDLGRFKHVASIVDASGMLVDGRSFQHSVEGISSTVDWLIDAANQDADRLSVAIEKPHGAVVETLLERGLAVFAINPKQVDRFRDRFSLSGAKDDRRDAFVLADALRTDQRRFQRLTLPPAEIILMRERLRGRVQLVKQHVALSSQLRELIVRCWPHLLELAPRNRAIDAFFAELLLLFFDTDNQSLDALRALIQKHRIRRVSFDDVVRALQSPPLGVAPATLQASTERVHDLIPQLMLVREQRRRLDQQLESWFLEIRRCRQPSDDAVILASLPGIGAVVLATMLTYAHEPIRLRHLDALRSLSGIAPVTKQSGRRRIVLLRRSRSQPLNYAVHHWAQIAVRHDHKSKQHYDRLRNNGHRHARALRGVADRLLTVAVAMLRNRSFYQSERRKELPT
jgi:transposase